MSRAGLLFGIHSRWPICTPYTEYVSGPAPVSVVLHQQRWCCARSRLLEIPTRRWSLRMSFMQCKPTELWLSFCCTGCFVKGLFNQIDTAYPVLLCIHMYGVTDLINDLRASAKITGTQACTYTHNVDFHSF